MKLKFWGVRGSIPTPGASTVKYGGNTSCVSVEADGHLIILDGGSGLRELGIEMMKKQFGPNGANPLHMSIFFSHVHWDHIQGVPFFKPMFIKGNIIKMYGEQKARTCLEDTLKGQQQYPNFPISVDEICINGAELTYTDLVPGQEISPSDLSLVRCTKLSHPDGVFCYQVNEFAREKERRDVSVVYATDTEHRNVLDPRLLKVANKANVLIYDAQYLPEEYSGEVGMPKFDWGHSTYEFGIDTAVKCGVEWLVLFHHEPEHTDGDIDNLFARAKEYLKENYPDSELQILAAEEGMELEIK